MTHEVSEGRDIQEGGEQQEGGGFQQRSPISTHINGSLMRGYVSTNFRIWQIALSWIVKLCAIVGTTYVTVVSVAAPHFREAVREIDAPLEARITLGEKRMDHHELQVAERALAYMTKEEIQREINRLQIEIGNLRDLIDRSR